MNSGLILLESGFQTPDYVFIVHKEKRNYLNDDQWYTCPLLEILVDFVSFMSNYNRIVFANKNLDQECNKFLEGFKEYLSYDHEEYYTCKVIQNSVPHFKVLGF